MLSKCIIPFPGFFKCKLCQLQLKKTFLSRATLTCMCLSPANSVPCNCTNKLGILGVKSFEQHTTNEGDWARCSHCFLWLLGIKWCEFKHPLMCFSPASVCAGQRKNLGLCTNTAGGFWGQKRVGLKKRDRTARCLMIFLAQWFWYFFQTAHFTSISFVQRRNLKKIICFGRDSFCPRGKQSSSSTAPQKTKLQSHLVKSFQRCFLSFC